MTETQDRVLNDRYRIEALIGRGGMADVYRAVDLSLERSVAVKMLRPDLARDPMFQTRFRREAQSSASLNHPNVVGVYDTGSAGVPENGGDVSTPFIVMEHVEGVTLRHILHGTPSAESSETAEGQDGQHSSVTVDLSGGRQTTGRDVLALSDEDATQAMPHVTEPLQERIDEALGRPLTEQEAAGYMSGVLAALSYSHSRGIVHRDIKPSNVMVSNAGDVKVMDFGIARALADSAQTMTQTSAVVGTAQYLSPEQARGELVDHRSDLYSAGCVLFELLTNRPPFTGESPVSVAYQHVREEPPAVSDFNNRVSPAMESVVAKALTKDPALRFQTAEEFNHALQGALHGIPADEAPTAELAAVGATPGSFDDLVAAGTGTPLSARTPEDPDIDDYYEDYRQPRRRSRTGLMVLLVLLALGLVIGGVFALTRLMGGPSDTVTVPGVQDLPRSEAYDELSDLGLNPEIQNEPSAEVESDHAIGTDPEEGEQVDVGSDIILFISTGSESVSVPENLIGETEQTVRAILEDVGLEVGEVTEEDHADFAQGEVISTDPEAGTQVSAGSAVNLVVSTGELQLPQGLLGQWQQDVGAILQAEGIDWQLQWQTLDDPEGYFAGEVFELTLNSPGGQEIPDGGSIPNDATVYVHAVGQSSWPDDEEPDDEGSNDEDEDEDSNGDSETEAPDDEETNGDSGDDEGNGEDDNDSGNDDSGNEDTDEDTGNEDEE